MNLIDGSVLVVGVLGVGSVFTCFGVRSVFANFSVGSVPLGWLVMVMVMTCM